MVRFPGGGACHHGRHGNHSAPDEPPAGVTGTSVAGLGFAGPLVSSCDHRVTDGGMMAGVAQILRGDLPQTSAMELLQIGYLHSVVAAAGCSLGGAIPGPGDRLDRQSRIDAACVGPRSQHQDFTEEYFHGGS
jgi:hypothetical protein